LFKEYPLGGDKLFLVSYSRIVFGHPRMHQRADVGEEDEITSCSEVCSLQCWHASGWKGSRACVIYNRESSNKLWFP